MDKAKAFEDFLKKIEEEANKKFGIPENECLTTSDGQKFNGHGYDCIKLILAGCTIERLKSIQMEELIDWMATNFIKSNTKDDLEEFMRHTIAIKLSNLIEGDLR